MLLSKVDGGETVTETTTTMSRETSGTLANGSKETSGSLGREENEQPLALRSELLSSNEHFTWECVFVAKLLGANTQMQQFQFWGHTLFVFQNIGDAVIFEFSPVYVFMTLS